MIQSHKLQPMQCAALVKLSLCALPWLLASKNEPAAYLPRAFCSSDIRDRFIDCVAML
jgi:hypothetical protein